MRSCKYFPHVKNIPTFTNNRAKEVLVLKKINNNKNKKLRVCLDFIQNRENTTDLPHVTDTLYHIIVYQVHEYTSIPRREHDSNFKFSVDRH